MGSLEWIERKSYNSGELAGMFTIYKNAVDEFSIGIEVELVSRLTSRYVRCEVKYSLNDNSYISAGSLYGIETFNIEGLTPNTKYNIKLLVQPTDYSNFYIEFSNLKTYDIPHCISSTDFIIGSNYTLRFENPLRRNFTFQIKANGVILPEKYSISSSSGIDMIMSTNGIKEDLYKTIPDSQYGEYEVITSWGNYNKTSSNHKRYFVDEKESRPTFTDFEYHDGNTPVVNVTGNNQVMIKGYSNLVVTIPTDYKMTAKNGSTARNYVVSVGTINKNGNYKGAEAVEIGIGQLNTYGTIRLSVTAYDSRGLYTTVNKNIVVYDYKKPVLNLEGTRLNNFETETTFKAGGEYSKVTIDNVDKNRVTKVEYRYRETGGTWSDWGTVTTTLTSGKYTCNDIILVLDRDKTYEYETKVTDLVDSTSIVIPIDKGIAVLLISSNLKECFINGKKVLPVDEIYPIGSIYMSINNVNPSNLFGGTWELIKDKFLLGAGDTYTGGATGGTATVTLTEAQMPSHSHAGINWYGGENMPLDLNTGTDYESGYALTWQNGTGNTGQNLITNPAGGGQPHENMPPYLAVYIWKRTA